MIAEEVCDTKTSLAKLASPITFYPQYTRNVRVRDKAAVLADRTVLAAKEAVVARIGGEGRVLLRESGTEPVVRVMIECTSHENCIAYANEIAEAIEKGGHTVG
jgi:phosphoglucosamine mutase